MITVGQLEALPVAQCVMSPSKTKKNDCDIDLIDIKLVDIDALTSQFKEGSTVSKRWQNPLLDGKTQSERDYGFAIALIKALPHLREIECIALLRDFRKRGDDHKGKADDIATHLRTLGKAKTKVHSDVAVFGSTAQANPYGGDPFRLYTVPELLERPRPEFLVDGVLPEKGLAVIAGAPGCYKSFLLISLSMSIAHNMPVGNRDVKQGIVWYLINEGAGSFGLRCKAWLQSYKKDHNDNFKVGLCTPQLTTEESIKEAIKGLRQHDQSPKMIVIDTLHKSIPGVKENDSTEMGRVMSLAYKLADEFDCLVVLIDHTGKNEKQGARGSNVKKANADMVGIVSRTSNTVSLRLDKLKDGEDGFTINFGVNLVQMPELTHRKNNRSMPVLHCLNNNISLSQPDCILHALSVDRAMDREDLFNIFSKHFPKSNKASFNVVLGRLKKDKKLKIDNETVCRTEE